MANKQQLCTLILREHRLAIPVQEVQEVLLNQDMTPVALAPLVVRGLINLRGQIVMAVDLKRRLGIQDSTTDAPLMNVLIRTEHGPVSLLVDDIGEVVEVEGDCDVVPPTLRGEIRDLIRGVYKLPTHLLLLLNTEKILEFGDE